jgi:subtilisin family serine protease
MGYSKQLSRQFMAFVVIFVVALWVPALAVAQVASWGLDRIDQRVLPLDDAFGRPAAAAAVTVYVVDTGVRADHEELAGRVMPGVNFVTDRKDSTDASDCHGHGTFVSAIVAGKTLGVSSNARIVPVRSFGCKASGWASEIAKGIRWAVERHVAGSPAVINLSVAMPASGQIDMAVEAALAAGITVVAAAGNNRGDACGSSPARVSGVITVGGTTQDDSVMSLSNTGRCVDVFAPGAWVTSAWAGSPTERRMLQGTSFAAPHVTGIVVEMLSSNPSLSPAQVHDAVVAAATRDVLKSVPAGSPNLLAYLPPLVAPPASTTTLPPSTTVSPTTTLPPTTTTTIASTTTTVPPTTTTLPPTTAPAQPQVSARRVCCGRWQITVSGVRPFEEFAVRALNSSRRPVQSISWLATADEFGNAMFFVPGVFDRHVFSLVRSGS